MLPNQVSPSLQSQPTEPAYAPPVHPMFLTHLQHERPQDFQVMHDLVQRFGGGVVRDDQVAATWWREGGFKWNPGRGADGEYGPIQVMPQTFDTMNRLFHYNLNPNDPKDAMAAGILYMRYLANDKGLGAGSIATNYAYMAGEGAPARARGNWSAELANPVFRKKLQSLDAMYDGRVVINASAMNPGATSGNESDYMRTVVQQTTPDGALSTMATMGPAGLGMTDRWRHLQAMMEGSAMAHGRIDLVGHVGEYIAQVAHQGTVSNLIAGYTAMQAGDMVGAAGAFAKAHAFFPDGTYARFGVDKQGRLGAVQFDEHTGLQMGPGKLLTPEMVMTQIIALQHPNTFTQVLDEHQKNNATIAQTLAHANFYNAQPGIKQALLDQKEQFQRDMQEERFRHADELKTAGAAGNAVTVEQAANQAVNTDFNPRMTKAREAIDDAQTALNADPNDKSLQEKLATVQAEYTRLGNESQISRELRIPVVQGGWGMAGPAADTLAGELTHGKKIISSVVMRDGTQRYGVYDAGTDTNKADSSRAYALLSPERGSRVRGLMGAIPVGGKVTVTTPPPPPNTQHTSAVGAGLNDPRMAGRYQTNLAGITPVSQAA